jgi:hypothetical protein
MAELDVRLSVHSNSKLVEAVDAAGGGIPLLVRALGAADTAVDAVFVLF